MKEVYVIIDKETNELQGIYSSMEEGEKNIPCIEKYNILKLDSYSV